MDVAERVAWAHTLTLMHTKLQCLASSSLSWIWPEEQQLEPDWIKWAEGQSATIIIMWRHLLSQFCRVHSRAQRWEGMGTTWVTLRRMLVISKVIIKLLSKHDETALSEPSKSGTATYLMSFQQEWGKEWPFITKGSTFHYLWCNICRVERSCGHRGRNTTET